MTDSPPGLEHMQAIADELSQLEPGFLPLPIFLQITRLSVTPIIEIVPLRKNGETTEVLLLRRPSDDPNWPNQLHTPGTVLRANDQEGNYSDAFQRIFKDELGLETTQEPVFVNIVFHQVKRGRELALIFFVEIHEAPSAGVFYDSESLPADIVPTQLGFIKMSVQSYNRRIKGESS